jgi:TatD DNase family protein
VIDTHCHLDLAAFERDRDEVIARATAAGVAGMLVPGIRPRTWHALREFASWHQGRGVRCAIGIHPQAVPELADDELADLDARLADAAGDAIAIGECGLDRATGALELQERIFRIHVRVARELGKPLVIHVLRAHDLAPRILREERCAGGVLHSYSGGAELVPVYRDLGLAFSFAGPITYPNARRPVEAARVIPPELLLVETDAPDQAPAAHRGGRCEPGFLPAVIAGLAAARDASVEEIAAVTTANARRLFGTWR